MKKLVPLPSFIFLTLFQACLIAQDSAAKTQLSIGCPGRVIDVTNQHGSSFRLARWQDDFEIVSNIKVAKFSGKIPNVLPIADTVRLLGWNSGTNPKVVIDGKVYKADMLTKISPSCIERYMEGNDEITITTKHQK